MSCNDYGDVSVKGMGFGGFTRMNIVLCFAVTVVGNK